MKKRSSLHHYTCFALQTVRTQTVPDFTTCSKTSAVPCCSRTLFFQAHLLHLPRRQNSCLINFIINLVPFYKTMVQGHRGAAWLWSPFAETLLFFMASQLGRYLSGYVRQVNNTDHVKFMIAAPDANCHRNTTQRPFSLKH